MSILCLVQHQYSGNIMALVMDCIFVMISFERTSANSFDTSSGDKNDSLTQTPNYWLTSTNGRINKSYY
jgi:hypothetical protein